MKMKLRIVLTICLVQLLLIGRIGTAPFNSINDVNIDDEESVLLDKRENLHELSELRALKMRQLRDTANKDALIWQKLFED